MSLLCHSLRRLLVVLVMQFRFPRSNFAAVDFIALVKAGWIHKDKILGIQWQNGNFMWVVTLSGIDENG
jgi:hypothetical protein